MIAHKDRKAAQDVAIKLEGVVDDLVEFVRHRDFVIETHAALTECERIVSELRERMRHIRHAEAGEPTP